MSGDMSDRRTNSILIATGIPLIVLSFGLALLIDWQATALSMMAGYILVRVIVLVKERRALDREDR